VGSRGEMEEGSVRGGVGEEKGALCGRRRVHSEDGGGAFIVFVAVQILFRLLIVTAWQRERERENTA